MQSKLGLHWIPEHQGNADYQYFRSVWKPIISKIVTSSVDKVPVVDVALDSSQYIVLRSHPISENFGNRNLSNPIEVAIRHAELLKILVSNTCNTYNQNPSRFYVEGINEPQIWTTNESPDKVVTYYNTLTELLYKEDIKVVALNIGVGWPGNHGVKDAPPDWKQFEDLIPVIKKCNGVLGIHEYWGRQGPKIGWGWLAGRWKFCPYDVPIMLTEIGLDSRAVADVDYYGWHGLESEMSMDKAGEEYVYNQLGWYDQQLQLDKRVIGSTIFTYDFQGREWATFDIRPDTFKVCFINHLKWILNQDIKNFTEYPLPYHTTEVGWYQKPYDISGGNKPVDPNPPVEPPIIPDIDNDFTAARWNTEESIREIEKLSLDYVKTMADMNGLILNTQEILSEIILQQDKIEQTRRRLIDNVLHYFYMKG